MVTVRVGPGPVRGSPGSKHLLEWKNKYYSDISVLLQYSKSGSISIHASFSAVSCPSRYAPLSCWILTTQFAPSGIKICTSGKWEGSFTQAAWSWYPDEVSGHRAQHRIINFLNSKLWVILSNMRVENKWQLTPHHWITSLQFERGTWGSVKYLLSSAYGSLQRLDEADKVDVFGLVFVLRIRSANLSAAGVK